MSISPVYGHFYNNSSYGNGVFDIDPSTAPVFSAVFPTLNFNPPTDAQESCSNATQVNENTRPFYDVIPQASGSCTVQAAAGQDAQGNTVYAGQTGSPLEAFEAVFTATVTVAQPGQVTFNLYSDDGWVLAVGPDGAGHQPTYLSGSMINVPASGTGAFTGYPIVGSYNQPSAPAQTTDTVNFPAAGTYPIELDYTECCGGQEALVLGTNFANPIQPTSEADPFRQIMFVHGINGNSRDIQQGGDYSELIGPLQTIYTPEHVHIFSYYQDRAYADPSTNPLVCLAGQGETPPTDESAVIPEQLQTLHDHQCDSQSDIGIDASALDDFVVQNSTSSDHVAIIAHSMGGAITRGYLALVQRLIDRTGIDPSANVDTVITFQGAQQGAFGAWVGRGIILTGAVSNPPYAELIALAEQKVPFYLNRPAVTELTPKSDWYNNINATRVPAHIHYFNFYSNIHTRIATAIPFGKWLTYAPVDWGDFVMQPGSDNPQDTPLLGGARF